MLNFTTVNQVETFLELEGFEFRKSNFYCPVRKVRETRWHVLLNGHYYETNDLVGWANSSLLPCPIA